MRHLPGKTELMSYCENTIENSIFLGVETAAVAEEASEAEEYKKQESSKDREKGRLAKEGRVEKKNLNYTCPSVKVCS